MVDVRNLYSSGETVTMTQLGKIIGITPAKIKGFMVKGLPYQTSGKTTLFDTVAATKWIIGYEVSSQLSSDEEYMTIDQAKRRSEVAKMLTLELVLAKEREQVANIDDLMLNFTTALIQVRAKLVSQPSRLSGLLSHQDQKEVNRLLEADSQEMLEALSGYQHEYIGYESGSTTEDSRVDKPRIPPMPKATPKT